MSKREILKRPLAAILADLPERCYARLPDGTAIEIVRGESGYRPASITDVERYNSALGVTPAQAEAMLAGSMFGFDVPGADPLNYPQLPATYTAEVRDQMAATFTSDKRR